MVFRLPSGRRLIVGGVAVFPELREAPSLEHIALRGLCRQRDCLANRHKPVLRVHGSGAARGRQRALSVLVCHYVNHHLGDVGEAAFDIGRAVNYDLHRCLAGRSLPVRICRAPCHRVCAGLEHDIQSVLPATFDPIEAPFAIILHVTGRITARLVPGLAAVRAPFKRRIGRLYYDFFVAAVHVDGVSEHRGIQIPAGVLVDVRGLERYILGRHREFRVVVYCHEVWPEVGLRRRHRPLLEHKLVAVSVFGCAFNAKLDRDARKDLKDALPFQIPAIFRQFRIRGLDAIEDFLGDFKVRIELIRVDFIVGRRRIVLQRQLLEGKPVGIERGRILPGKQRQVEQSFPRDELSAGLFGPPARECVPLARGEVVRAVRQSLQEVVLVCPVAAVRIELDLRRPFDRHELRLYRPGTGALFIARGDRARYVGRAPDAVLVVELQRDLACLDRKRLVKPEQRLAVVHAPVEVTLVALAHREAGGFNVGGEAVHVVRRKLHVCIRHRHVYFRPAIAEVRSQVHGGGRVAPIRELVYPVAVLVVQLRLVDVRADVVAAVKVAHRRCSVLEEPSHNRQLARHAPLRIKRRRRGIREDGKIHLIARSHRNAAFLCGPPAVELAFGVGRRGREDIGVCVLVFLRAGQGHLRLRADLAAVRVVGDRGDGLYDDLNGNRLRNAVAPPGRHLDVPCAALRRCA